MKRPPFELTATLLRLVSQIAQSTGRLQQLTGDAPRPELRRVNQVRSIHGSLGIEGNTLSIEQITAVLDGHRVLGPKNEIVEIQNALDVYGRLGHWKPLSSSSLLEAHATLMRGLHPQAGRWRSGSVGVLSKRGVAHVAPPARRVPFLMDALFEFLEQDVETHILVKACVFHYELEFIHPFSDGNGRMGRLWQQLLLMTYDPLFEFLPVESIVRDEQEEYYRVLAACNACGNSTEFVEFALGSVLSALRELEHFARPRRLSPDERLTIALRSFGRDDFARADYLRMHPKLTPLTASRDLARGVERGRLTRIGDRSLARYRAIGEGCDS